MNNQSYELKPPHQKLKLKSSVPKLTNMATRLKYLKRPKLKRPVIIAGLPGIASIGKLAVEYLINKLGAQKFLELYSDYFPEWVIQKEGIVNPLRIDFFNCKPNGLRHNMILVTSDAQAATPVGQYALTGEVLDIARHFRVTTVGTMAAYVLSPQENRSVPVMGTASDSATARRLVKNGVKLLKSGVVVGMNGMLPGMAPLKEIIGFCLLGTTKGGLLDANASAAVLRAVSTMFGFKLDLNDLEKHADNLAKIRPPLPMPELSENVDEEPSYIR